ncbi:CAP domain-containing protein [Sorangium sp. So ce1078]|uniref:CAP domain-containing protein n=1 Tax=Sorangium sp. So ce1078 TaxID=3133329 RepID=UPI003F5F9FAE
MLNPSTHSRTIALAATIIASVLSGCIGELGSVLTEGEGSGTTSGADVGSDNGPPGGGPTTGSGGSTSAGTGGSPAGGDVGSTSAGAGGGGASTSVGAGGSGASTSVGAGGSAASTSAGTGGSGASTSAGAGGSGGSPAGGTGGAGGSGGSGGSGSGSGGNDGPTSAAQLCVDTINQHRATLGLPPLSRWIEAESCSDGECESDGNSGQAHGAFGACDERAQNECPGWPGPPESMIEPCLQLMWDEGPGEDFNAHGHYINMSSTAYTQVACGFHTFPDGSVWAVQNFR